MEKRDINKKEEVRHCVICDAEKKVIKVEKLPNKTQFTLECGHTFGEIVVVVNEKIGISEDTAWVILKDPVADVKRAINEQDYFKTATHGSVLEYCGQKILLWNSKNTANPLTANKVKKWKLEKVIIELLNYGLISATEATKLHDIRDLRNDFVQRLCNQNNLCNS